MGWYEIIILYFVYIFFNTFFVLFFICNDIPTQIKYKYKPLLGCSDLIYLIKHYGRSKYYTKQCNQKLVKIAGLLLVWQILPIFTYGRAHIYILLLSWFGGEAYLNILRIKKATVTLSVLQLGALPQCYIVLVWYLSMGQILSYQLRSIKSWWRFGITLLLIIMFQVPYNLISLHIKYVRSHINNPLTFLKHLIPANSQRFHVVRGKLILNNRHQFGELLNHMQQHYSHINMFDFMVRYRQSAQEIQNIFHSYYDPRSIYYYKGGTKGSITEKYAHLTSTDYDKLISFTSNYKPEYGVKVASLPSLILKTATNPSGYAHTNSIVKSPKNPIIIDSTQLDFNATQSKDIALDAVNPDRNEEVTARINEIMREFVQTMDIQSSLIESIGDEELWRILKDLGLIDAVAQITDEEILKLLDPDYPDNA